MLLSTFSFEIQLLLLLYGRTVVSVGVIAWFQMARPEQSNNLVDEDALQRAQEKRRKVDQGVTEKVSTAKKMYGALDACIKRIGKQSDVVRTAVDCVLCGHAAEGLLFVAC